MYVIVRARKKELRTTTCAQLPGGILVDHLFLTGPQPNPSRGAPTSVAWSISLTFVSDHQKASCFASQGFLDSDLQQR